MPDNEPAASQDLTALTVQLLSAFVANNKLDHGELPSLIQSTRAALAAPPPAPAAEPEAEQAFTRAVPIKRSLADPDRIVSMIDGKPYRTLTRHLKANGLTPAEYRARYKLPADYPTIAPGYSEQRRQIARTLGLGRKPAAATVVAEAVEAAAPATAEAPEAAAAPSEPARTPARRGSGRRASGAKSANVARAKPSAAAAATAPATDATPKTRGRRTSRDADAIPADAGATPPRPRRGRRESGGEPT